MVGKVGTVVPVETVIVKPLLYSVATRVCVARFLPLRTRVVTYTGTSGSGRYLISDHVA